MSRSALLVTHNGMASSNGNDVSSVISETEEDAPEIQMEEDASPSIEDVVSLEGAAAVSSSSLRVEQLKTSILLKAAVSDRGQSATESEKAQMEKQIRELELLNPDPSPTSSSNIQGTWELCYSSTQLFRSSPFFMAGRAVCQTEDEAKRYDWFCDMHRAALAISVIGKVRQVISPTRMVSEFEVKAGAVPFLSDLTPFSYSGGLPVTIDGAIVSSADIKPIEEGTAWQIYMDTVEIKGSNMPLVRNILDSGLRLESRNLATLLEENVPSYETPRPVFRTFYLDDNLRISRDQDGKVFVYAKVSDKMEPTNYAEEENGMSKADLGIGNLLDGFKSVFM